MHAKYEISSFTRFRDMEDPKIKKLKLKLKIKKTRSRDSFPARPTFAFFDSALVLYVYAKFEV